MELLTKIKHLFFRKKLTPALKEIKKELRTKRKSSEGGQNWKPEDKNLIAKITEETAVKNKNNLTRTKAYVDFYLEFPDIHWALLAHMVSRNGGYNMTDLKGELLSNLLSKEQQAHFFAFIERSNWLIFQDAYPQLLIFRESVKSKTNLFHLLPAFGVSKFMEVLWHYFWTYDDKDMLTKALIINEQNYIEKRVIQNEHYKHTVVNTLPFNLQRLLQLNQILFPYADGKQIKLIGQTVHHFETLEKRILLGKRLYKLLFDNQEIFKWVADHPHTGSRNDYWPRLFTNVETAKPYKKRHCQLTPSSQRFYSPRLENAWDNVDHKEAEKGDWYSDWKVIDYLQEDNQKVDGDIEAEYCETVEKMELAVLAKKSLLH